MYSVKEIKDLVVPNATRTVITTRYPQEDGEYNRQYQTVLTRLWSEQETYESLRELWVTTGDVGYLERMVDHVTE